MTEAKANWLVNNHAGVFDDIYLKISINKRTGMANIENG